MTSEEQAETPILPTVAFKSCPIRTSLGVLGKKWTLLILRDIAFLKVDRFNRILRSIPGLTPRVLTLRLRELREDGIIEPVAIQRGPRLVRWRLTKMGQDTIPILMDFISFGATWYPDTVFEDGKPRTAEELFPDLSAVGARPN
ncbi:MAG TPA: helix-turn-helix domain-containing protein [Nitrososphaerales archaeon]|nr:helix-turn-helix domain-containing protein [Nitrososphaerales archaeon]